VCILITPKELNKEHYYQQNDVTIFLKPLELFHNILAFKLPDPALGAVSSAKYRLMSSAFQVPSAAVRAFIAPHFCYQALRVQCNGE
jgi:hypothetical protein